MTESNLDLARERYRRDRPAVLTPAQAVGASAFVGKVVTASPAGQFMTVTPYVISGSETQGTVGTYTAAGSNLLVLNLGPATPAAGDYQVCRWADHRWVTQRKTAGGGGGGCGYPLTLDMEIAPYGDSDLVNWPAPNIFSGAARYAVVCPPSDSPNGPVTWGDRPDDVPATVSENTSTFPTITWRTRTMPDPGWYGPELAYSGTDLPGGTRGWVFLDVELGHVGTGIVVNVPGDAHDFQLTLTAGSPAGFTCTPFSQHEFHSTNYNVTTTGTHGGDDLSPDGFGSIGKPGF